MPEPITAAAPIRVHLLAPPSDGGSADDRHRQADFRIVARSAALGAEGFQRVDDPDQADVLLFIGSADPLHRDVRRHPLSRRHPRRVVLYSSADWLIPWLPGLYPGLPRSRHNPHRTRSAHYLRWSDQSSITPSDPETAASLLFGFSGDSGTAPLRRRVLALRHPRALLRDTHADPGRGFGQQPHIYHHYRDRYNADLAAVRFVLCPRGQAPATMRLFEAMKAARVPVLIADDWLPPAGPDWGRFLLRVPERRLEQLIPLLERHEAQAAAMGREARRAWEQWFAPEVSFPVLSAAAAELVAGSWPRERLERLLVQRRLLAPLPLRQQLLAPLARRLLRRRPSPAG